MPLYFLETSALVKLYVKEPGTERLLPLVEPGKNNRFAILSFSQIEFRSAIRKRQRSGEIPASLADKLLDLFQRHRDAIFLTQGVNDFALDRAALLVDRHALRAYDAIQLGGYLALCNATPGELPVFVSSDNELLNASAIEGIPSLNPCS